MGGSFVVGSHHLAKSMVKMGHEVVHLSPPITPAHLLLLKNKFERRRFMRWLSSGEMVNGVLDIIPSSLLPWGVARFISKLPHRIFSRFVSLSVKSLIKKLNIQPEIVFIDEPRLAGLIDFFKDSKIIYRPTDLYAEIRCDKSIILAECMLICRSDKFIATSEPVSGHLKGLGAKEVLVLENGVDLDVFRIPKGDLDMAIGKRNLSNIVYVGAFDSRFGFDSIEAAAEFNHNLKFILIGPIQDSARSRLSRFNNIKIIGAVNFEHIPGYLLNAALAILPLSNDPSNQGRSPMKLYEYAAMGLPVVATYTTELARRDLGFVCLADSPDDFAKKVSDVITGKISLGDPKKEVFNKSWERISERALSYALS